MNTINSYIPVVVYKNDDQCKYLTRRTCLYASNIWELKRASVDENVIKTWITGETVYRNLLTQMEPMIETKEYG